MLCLTRKTTKHPAPSPELFYTRDFDTCFARQRRALRHLSFQKWSEAGVPCAFGLGKSWKRALRQSTSKSGPNVVGFAHLKFEMRFAPQWRALFAMSLSKSGLRPSVFFTQRRAIFHLSYP